MKLPLLVRSDAPTISRKVIVLAGILVLLVPAVYSPALRGDFIWDDVDNILQMQPLRTLEGLGKIWTDIHATHQYYPIVFTTFWIEFHSWGLNPLGYHIVNVLLHTLDALLLWVLLARFLRVPGAWLAAVLFAIHPLQVESVAWITERKNVLSAFFSLLTVMAYLKFSPLPMDTVQPAAFGTGPSPSRRWMFYGLALLLFAMSLASKTAVAPLPGAILLLIWWKRGRITWRDVAAIAPFVVLSVCSGLVTLALETNIIEFGEATDELGAIGRILLAGRVLSFYAAKLLLPVGLSFNYPHWTVDRRIAWQYLLPALVVAALGALWLLRRRVGRGPLAAVLVWVVLLAPVSGLFDVWYFRYSYVTDHFQYHASMALLALLSAVLASGADRLGASRGRIVLGAASAALVLGLGLLAYRQAGWWRGPEKIWRETLRTNDRSWLAANNLGGVLLGAGRVPEALAMFQRCLEINPGHRAAIYNRGFAYYVLGRHDAAIQELNRLLILDPSWPKAHDTRGLAYMAKKDYEAAIADFDSAIEHDAHDAAAFRDRATAYASKGDLRRALADYTKSIELDPGDALAHVWRGALYTQWHDYPSALRNYDRAIALDPNLLVAYYNRAVAHFNQGQVDKAREDMRIFRQLGGTADPAFLEALRAAWR